MYKRQLADSPVHIVHLSSAEGLEEVRRARAAGQKVWAETCPQYLLLDESRYHLEGFEGAKYVMSPPLRSPADREGLRAAVLGGEIDTISTDHCSYRFSDQKAVSYTHLDVYKRQVGGGDDGCGHGKRVIRD